MSEGTSPKTERPLLKLFLWTFGIFVVILAALLVLSNASPDSPFVYVLQ